MKRHQADGFGKRCNGTVMKIRGRFTDIPQGWDFEIILVRRIPGYTKTPQVFPSYLFIGNNGSETLVLVPPDINAVVT